MEKLNLEVVKSILISRLNQKIARKDLIDEEIKTLMSQKDSVLDIDIEVLERKINDKLNILECLLHRKQRQEDELKLKNLKLQKTIFHTIREQNIEKLLKEKESLAYNDYNYMKRILEIENSETFEQLNLNEEEKEYLNILEGYIDNDSSKGEQKTR